MDEFKNNKDGKIEELKVSRRDRILFWFLSKTVILMNYIARQADILKQKTALQKQSVVVKTQQKELQTATLELGNLPFAPFPFEC
jgi:structural maintenance of chromosome 2